MTTRKTNFTNDTRAKTKLLKQFHAERARQKVNAQLFNSKKKKVSDLINVSKNA